MSSEEDVLRILQKEQLECYHTTESEEDDEYDQQSQDDNSESVIGNILDDLETETKNELAQIITLELEYRKKRKFWHTNKWKVYQKESKFHFRKRSYKIQRIRQKFSLLFKFKLNAF